VNMLQSIEWVFDELGPLVSQPGCPLLQPTINLMGQLIRPDQTQQRPNQDLDQHRQQLNIVITDKRSNALKIATQIGLDDRKARTRRSSTMATYHSREVLSTRRRGRGLPRRGSPGLNIREISTGLHLPAG
jgi:hypothetical protein